MASSTFPSVDLISTKTKQNKQKREFSAAAAAFLLVCLIENQQRYLPLHSFLFFLYFFPLFSIVGSSFWLLLAFIVCVYRLQDRPAVFVRISPRLYLFYKLKQKKIKRNQMKSFALRRWCWIVSCWCVMYTVRTYYARARESGAGAVSSHVTQSRNFRMMDLLLLFLALC